MSETTRIMPPREFSAVLTPNRSLSREGFLALMLALMAVAGVSGAVFLSMGAWPVTVFFGLDVLLVYVAFRLNYRDGRAYERVDVGPEVMTVTRMSARGRAQNFTFNPHWVRIELTESADGSSKLKLRARGEELSIATCLSDEERRSFADALRDALVAARGGPRI